MSKIANFSLRNWSFTFARLQKRLKETLNQRFAVLRYGCESKLLNLSSFDKSNVTRMDYMFAGGRINTIIVSDGWITENVVSENGMFTFCGGLTTCHRPQLAKVKSTG